MLRVGEARQVLLVHAVDLDGGRLRLGEVEGHEEVIGRIAVMVQVRALRGQRPALRVLVHRETRAAGQGQEVRPLVVVRHAHDARNHDRPDAPFRGRIEGALRHPQHRLARVRGGDHVVRPALVMEERGELLPVGGEGVEPDLTALAQAGHVQLEEAGEASPVGHQVGEPQGDEEIVVGVGRRQDLADRARGVEVVARGQGHEGREHVVGEG